MDTTVIYAMVGVGKTHQPSKQVLRDISLSYFNGAKIGVIGLNGAGKSTLLRIMAGVGKALHGDTILAPGSTMGSLEQEPVLDAMNVWELDSRLELAIDALRCPPGASAAADRPHRLTYRTLRRV